jgi:hypothetical protein
VFKAVAPTAFKVALLPGRHNGSIDHTDPGAMVEYHVGESYKIATYRLDAALTQVSSGSVDDVTFTLSDTAPKGFFCASFHW